MSDEADPFRAVVNRVQARRAAKDDAHKELSARRNELVNRWQISINAILQAANPTLFQINIQFGSAAHHRTSDEYDGLTYPLYPSDQFGTLDPVKYPSINIVMPRVDSIVVNTDDDSFNHSIVVGDSFPEPEIKRALADAVEAVIFRNIEIAL